MTSAWMQTLRSNWFTITVHAALWLLVYLGAASLGGKSPEYWETDSFSTPPHSPVAVTRLEGLFPSEPWTNSFAETNALDPFFTRYFVPPPTPAPAPPTTRKIEVTYRGFYYTGDSPKRALVKLGEALVITPVGSLLETNLFIADASARSLILTNLTAETNVLTLNTQKVIEVPIR
jgi:hypothetical protein